MNGSLTSLGPNALPEWTDAFAVEVADVDREGVAHEEDWNSKTSNLLADAEKRWRPENGSAVALLEFFLDEAVVFSNLVVDDWFPLYPAIRLDLVWIFRDEDEGEDEVLNGGWKVE